MSEVGKGIRLHRNEASGEWEVLGSLTNGPSGQGEGNREASTVFPPEHFSPGTILYTGPERAVPGRGFAPVVPNDAWEPEDHSMPYWCVRRGGIIPRVHQPEHFVLFDPALPAYRRCARCGWSIYTGVGRG